MTATSNKPLSLHGDSLTETDYQNLERRWISPVHADGAFIRRVDSMTACEELGRDTRGDYSGLLIPYIWPGEDRVREVRIRRDHPEMLIGRGGQLKPNNRYVSPAGRGNILYFAPGTRRELLANDEIPLVITEGEFKTLALWRLAWETADDAAENPAFLPVGLPGVWNWRGTVGKTTDADGARVDVKGPIPDLDKIVWQGRRVTIIFDADINTNDSVTDARLRLTEELIRRGARVFWYEWPKDVPPEQKGIDDYLAANGAEEVLRRMRDAKERSKRRHFRASTGTTIPESISAQLIRNDRGNPLPILTNAKLLLEATPEWQGVLVHDEFAMRISARRPTPWGRTPAVWSPHDDSMTQDWLQRAGLYVRLEVTTQAIEHVAWLNPFHPVREYLGGLKWDGQPRLDCWVATYLGVEETDYARAVGAKWLISAVARIYEPGAKADCALILEGPQGIKKSTALRSLATPWFTDEIADLGSKDASMQVRGTWIIEIAELDSMSRGEASRVKSFMSRTIDRFRPPYGKRLIESPRQSVFAGTVNHGSYLRDETGGRRFWPIACTVIDIDALTRDRDQLWAEAVTRYKAGEPWYLTTASVISAAAAEQAARYSGDPWHEAVQQYVENCERHNDQITIKGVLTDVLKLELSRQTNGDMQRVGRCLSTMGYHAVQIRHPDGSRLRVYRKRE